MFSVAVQLTLILEAKRLGLLWFFGRFSHGYRKVRGSLTSFGLIVCKHVLIHLLGVQISHISSDAAIGRVIRFHCGGIVNVIYRYLDK